jgi:uncharacterized SAM-binding protein YcdF (DUF218 family)
MDHATAFALGALVGFLFAELGVAALLGIDHAAGWIVAWGIVGLAVAAVAPSAVVPLAALGLLAVYFAIAGTPVMGAATRGWARSDPPSGPLDAVVVLSSGVNSDSTIDATGTERLLTALETLRDRGAARLVTTRIYNTHGRQSISSDYGQGRLIRLAGADSVWSIVDSVFSTRDEALQSARLLLPGSPRIALVTSPPHSRRACAAFEAVGFHVSCVPAREILHVTRDPASFDDRLAAFRTYAYERLGMIKYRAKGWIRR